MASACATVGASAEGSRLERIQASPQFKDGTFANKIPPREPEFFKTAAEYFNGADHTTPQEPIPVLRRERVELEALPQSGLRVTWFGHSSALVEVDGARLLLDPVWSRRASPFSFVGPKRFFEIPMSLEDLPALDAILISHDHYDHLDRSTVERLADRTEARFVVPLGVGAHLERWGIRAGRIVELDWWDAVRVGRVTVTATPARHFSGRSLVMADRNKTLWAGFAMNGPKHGVYYTGDTAMFEGFEAIGERLGPFDATLVEVGAYNRQWADLHLGPEQAVEAVKKARGGLMIPVHWATFNLAMHSWTEPAERLLVATEKLEVPLTVPRPGQSVEPGDPPKLTRWWPDLPWETAKEHPIISSTELLTHSDVSEE